MQPLMRYLRLLLPVLLVTVVGLLVGDPALAQGGRGPRSELSTEARLILAALEKQRTTRWQGERVLTVYGAKPGTDQRWIFRDGVEPQQGKGPAYFITKPKALSAEGAPQFRAQIAAADTMGLPDVPWFAEPSQGSLMERFSPPPHQRLEGALRHLQITPLGTQVADGSKRSGKAFRLRSPVVQGGYVELVLDDQLGLPLQVVRYGLDGSLRFRSSYRQLEAGISDAQFWFAPAVKSPGETIRGLGPLRGRLGVTPEQAERRRGFLDTLLPRLHERGPLARLPAGYEPAGKDLLQLDPFPIVTSTFSDGLNPITLFVARLPQGMARQEHAERLQARLSDGPHALRGNWKIHVRENWILLATGELEDQILEEALVGLEQRLDGGLVGQRGQRQEPTEPSQPKPRGPRGPGPGGPPGGPPKG